MPPTEPADVAAGPTTPVQAPMKDIWSAPATPASQASTAPPTPMKAGCLPDLQPLSFGRMHSAGSSTLCPDADEAGQPVEVLEEAEAETDGDSSWGAAEEADAERAISIGMPPLSSELGKWAQRTARAEEWLEGRLSTKFVVDNSHLRALTVGMAWRLTTCAKNCDRSIDGPYWGTTVSGVDLGDGWVRCGPRYLPKFLEGEPVLIPAECFDEVIPANSLDLDGVVHRFACTGRPVDGASRLGSLRRRRAARRTEGRWDDLVLCPDPGGKVCIQLYLDDDRGARAERLRRRRAALRRRQGGPPRGVLSVDAEGVVQDGDLGL
mmetsp:Transcript_46646/g.123189  ORF Transcript_46646/g.123189 Transcript_46646/m.123189 type:complete len:322 (-) Transcript_46646:12-977(-)